MGLTFQSKEERKGPQTADCLLSVVGLSVSLQIDFRLFKVQCLHVPFCNQAPYEGMSALHTVSPLQICLQALKNTTLQGICQLETCKVSNSQICVQQLS
jgi:hypothetical protein